MDDLAYALLFGVVIVVAVGVVALVPWLTRDRVLRGLSRQRLLVFTTTAEVFDGLLVRHDESSLVFIDVHARSSAVPVPAAAGELILPRERIAYTQHLATDGAMTAVPPPTDLAAPAAA